MKKYFVCILILLFSTKIFSASIKDAQERLLAIEDFKNEILNSKTEKVFSDEEMQALNLFYDVLENDEYKISSLDGGLNFKISEYNLVETLWSTEIYAKLFGNILSFERSVDILYSDAMEKRYVAEQDMTKYQRRDYEYYISDYDQKLHEDKNFFYVELTFKLTHWLGPSEYRFEPISLIIYKNPNRPHAIINIDERENKEIFVFKEQEDYRTKNQKSKESERIQDIVNTEKINSNESKSKKTNKAKQKKRRSFYINLDSESLNFSSESISSLSRYNAYGNLTLGLTDFVFAGISIGTNLDSNEKKETIYSFGALLGANVTLFNFFRPYVELGAAAITNDTSRFKCGSGFDIIIGHFMLNIEYNYNWTSGSEEDSSSRYSSYSAGIGFTW